MDAKEETAADEEVKKPRKQDFFVQTGYTHNLNLTTARCAYSSQ